MIEAAKIADGVTVLGNVLLDERCPECQGTGVIQDAEWKAWWARHPERPAMWDPVCDAPPDVPEETECWQCDGCGYRLTEEGRLLERWLRRHWGA